MDCRILFYSARKTSLCERAVKTRFTELNLSLAGVSFAVDGLELGKQLSTAFSSCNLVFVIGGLNLDDSRGIKSIISNVLSDSVVDESHKLHNSKGKDGYVIRAGQQLLVLLPDNPDQIIEIMQGPVGRYIQNIENVEV